MSPWSEAVDHAVVQAQDRIRAAGEVEIAMGPDALTGFLSWLESAPPGRSIPWAS